MVAALGRAGVLQQEQQLTERSIRSLLRGGCDNGHQQACDSLLEFEARIAATAAAANPTTTTGPSDTSAAPAPAKSE